MMSARHESRPSLAGLGWRVVRAAWKDGPEAGHDGEAIVSFTDFTFARWRDLPAAWLAGLRLRRTWPGQPGAIGLMLWAKPLSRRSGSISIWQTEADLGRFVGSPSHVATVRAFRARMSGMADAWSAAEVAPGEAIAKARERMQRL